MKRRLVAICAVLLIPFISFAQQSYKLWYNQPSSYWTDALPLGNGRLGAMVYGIPQSDTLQINEDTFWSGSPYQNTSPNAKKVLKTIQEHISNENYIDAQKLALENIIGDRNITSHGQVYQSVGNLVLTFPEHTHYSNYYRELDLNTAVAKTKYTVNGVEYVREAFTSLSDNLIIIRLTASKPKSLTFNTSFVGPIKKHMVTVESAVDAKAKNELEINGKLTKEKEENIPNLLRFNGRIKVLTDGGKQVNTANSIQVTKATSATIYISVATNFVNYKDISGNPEQRVKDYLAKFNKSYAQAKQDHINAYQKQFNRVSLDLGDNKVQSAKPTDVRIKEFSETHDPSLLATYFQFGRYLLIASSQPGTQPANLQGIWNPNAGQYPAWDSKYTTNINVEMNYWPAEMTNLSECHEPFIQLIKDVAETGKQSASEMYGARGWTLHHNTDIWRSTGAVDKTAGIWPTCNAWFAFHLWERFLYSGDKKYLQEVYPILKSASEFYADFLIKDKKTGHLVVSPSISPEHTPGLHSYEYINAKGEVARERCVVFAGVTMDNQMVFDLLSNTIDAAGMLNVDPEFAKELESLRAQLSPMRIGQHTQLQEWMEDWDRKVSGHRHISHLWGAYPGWQISPYTSPQLFEASRNSLIGKGDASRGWSMGWKVSLWARFLDGNKAYTLIQNQLKLKPATATIKDPDGGTYANMFDAHPPFQIDGNFGCTAGFAELLVQSHDGAVSILPALPDALKDGNIKGLRTRGGFEIVNLEWKDGKVATFSVKSTIGGNLRLRTYDKLQGNSPMKVAEGENANPLFKRLPVEAPVISPKASFKGTLLKPVLEYDVATKAGEVYTFKLAQ